jgi:hypothetical protein
MAHSRAYKWAQKHEAFRQEFNTIWEACAPERRQAVADRRFYSISGAQYEDALGEQFENSPRFEYNKTHQSVIRVFNEYRNNRISVTFRPKDEDSSPETAETLTGRYRADEQRCNAQEAYDNSFEEAVGGGMGAFRFRVVADDDEDADTPDDDEDTDVAIAIEPIFDADSSVFFDLDAKRQDKADAKRCYVITSVSRARYEADNPGVAVSTWPKPTSSTYFDWCTPDVVYVAEVYEIEIKGDVRRIYKSQLTEEEVSLDNDDLKDEQYLKDLEAQGYIHARDEKTKRRKVHKWTMNGAEITSDDGYLPGRCIPVIPVYGKRWFVDNIERFMGQVRLQKDMQRLLNMMISWLAELNSLTPYEIPLLTPEQVAGHQVSWAEGNIKRHPYRLINATVGPDGSKMPQGPVATLKPPDVPPGLAALLQVSVAAMDQLGGSAPAQEQDVASNISGKAVELIQQRIDMQSFIYTDNMAKAMQRAGDVWLSMQKDIMPDEEFSAPVVKPDGTQDFVKMNTPGLDAKGQRITLNDPRAGKYGCLTDVGPSFKSRRDATVRSLLGLLQVLGTVDPQEASVLAAAIIMNIDGEGLEDLRKYYRKKLVQMGVVEPTDEEKKELQEAAQNAPPDANAEFLLAEAKKALALAEKAHADALQALTKASNNAADTKLKEQQSHATHVDTTLAVAEAAGAARAAAGGGAPPAPAPVAA